jgi:nitrite reductase (NADH) large subunit
VTSVRLPLKPANSPLWVAAQGGGVVLTGVLVVALFVRPAPTLHVLWDMVVPLLPAVFLVNPLLWRTVCPLATLNALTGERVGMQRLGAERIQTAWGLGILLLAMLVPARRFLYNTSGPALAITIIAVALIALGMGLVFARRAGFCNALCPVLPVEKLYGQAPLVSLRTSRCADCSLCTPVGCIDLASNKSVPQTVGRARRDGSWVWTPFGIFAAAFPGFITGYFTVANGDLETAISVYTHVAMYAAASYLIVSVVAHFWSAHTKTLFLMLGGTAFMLYYWYAAPGLADAYGAARLGPFVVRLTAAMLLTLWCWRILRRPLARMSA